MSRALDPVRAACWREAAEWHVTLRAKDVSEEEFAAWIDWCQADPANVAAYEEMEALCEGAIRVKAPSKPAPLIRTRYWIPLAAAAAIAGALWLSLLHAPTALPPTAVVQSTSGQDREALLPDGSVLSLSAQSAVSLQFEPQERRLTIDRGQAFFKVAVDKSRPFIVDAGAVTIRAVGTAFDVRKNVDRIAVSVEEGIVEVVEAAATGKSESPVRIAAGFQYVWDRGDARVRLTQIDPAAAGAWRQGRLEYIAEPFAVVIANVNRYSPHPIRIADPETESLVFTGTVLTAGVEDWLDAIPRAFAVDLVRQSDGAVVIRKRAAPLGSTESRNSPRQ